MPLFKANSVLKTPITLSQAGQIVAATGDYAVPVTLAASDIVALCHLPAEHEPVDFMLQSDDLDSNGTPTISVTVGVLNADMSDLVANSNFITASNVAQTGGVARAVVTQGLQLAASNANRVVGLKVVTAAATKVAGTVKGTLLYRRKQG